MTVSAEPNPDYSAFDEAMENSQKGFEEYRAIIKKTTASFDTKIDTRIESRKQPASNSPLSSRTCPVLDARERLAPALYSIRG